MTSPRTTGNSSVHCFTNCQNISQHKINKQHRKSSSKKMSLVCLWCYLQGTIYSWTIGTFFTIEITF